jgi:hypothetical protein
MSRTENVVLTIAAVSAAATLFVVCALVVVLL